MEVSVSSTPMVALALHGLQGAHATVLLETHSIAEEVLARSLCCPRQHGAHHHCKVVGSWIYRRMNK